MGMYDTICGDQVKCFYKYYEYKDELWRTGGSLRYFGIGDKVPYRTGWYNYTKNFNIINIWDSPFDAELSDPNMLIGIRDGKVKFVKQLGLAEERDWDNIERCITYDGEWLRVNSQEEAMAYAKAIKEYDLKKTEYLMNNMPYKGKAMDFLHGIAVVDKEEKARRFSELEAMEEKKKQEFDEFARYDKCLMREFLDPFEKGVKPDRVLEKEEKGIVRNIKRQKKKKHIHKL